MSEITLTVTIAFILIVLSLVGVGIGWFLTGKRVRHCGLNTGAEQDDSCGKKVSCPVCEKKTCKSKKNS